MFLFLSLTLYTARVTLGAAVLAQRVTMPTKFICKFPLCDQFQNMKLVHIGHVTAGQRPAYAYAELLAIKEGPLCFLSWNNEAKNKPIDRPHLATKLDVSKRANNFEPGGCNNFWPRKY